MLAGQRKTFLTILTKISELRENVKTEKREFKFVCIYLGSLYDLVSSILFIVYSILLF